MTSYCQYTPDKKEQSTQNQTKICAIIVFYVYFVLYIELLFGDVGLNGSLKINIPLVVKFIDDTKITSQNHKYFADLQSGVFVYFLVCPTGESVFGFSFGENNGSYFGCQILTSGFDMDIKIRNCAWATKWSEWRTL